ncbi:branched-subunit amino acid transport protein [Comamonas sp. BIGb0124]|uniref:AzlD domain-containing protein n=1 Tax=Comamonas sp. BIGb0124 TaxID=2485130 RepID=UPI000F49903B|nr:AzlD domain-containing protein [Comamonas sp. BIGb0124]ROR20849.1 branched-subunit amino acid transport protein [Comamonas sp. BIGb0124]
MNLDGWTLVIILGMAAMTVVTRAFFFLFDRPWHLPQWAHRGLAYAPAAALAAVVAPEILTLHGYLVNPLTDARIYAVIAGVASYFWRRSMLATIICGMAVYLPLHIGLGW